jgi:hypothetical protein
MFRAFCKTWDSTTHPSRNSQRHDREGRDFSRAASRPATNLRTTVEEWRFSAA